MYFIGTPLFLIGLFVVIFLSLILNWMKTDSQKIITKTSEINIKKIKAKEVFFKSINHLIKDFKNLVKIAFFPFVISLPFFLYQTYYDEIIMNYDEVSWFKTSYIYKIIDYMIIVPLLLAFISNWHKYLLFDGKDPWKYKYIDFSKDTFKFIYVYIKFFLLFFIPSIVIIYSISIAGILTYKNFNYFIAIYFFIWFVYCVRTMLIFPATVFGDDNSLNRILKITRDNFSHLFFVFIFYLIFLLIIFVIWIIFFLFLEYILGLNFLEPNSLSFPFIFINSTLYLFIFFAFAILHTILFECYKTITDSEISFLKDNKE
jgi:hypothetical protein